MAGFRSVVNQACVPYFSGSPDRSAEQCRPCLSYSPFGYDEDKCNNGKSDDRRTMSSRGGTRLLRGVGGRRSNTISILPENPQVAYPSSCIHWNE